MQKTGQKLEMRRSGLGIKFTEYYLHCQDHKALGFWFEYPGPCAAWSALVLITTLIALLDLGLFTMIMAIIIATSNAGLIVAFFMHGLCRASGPGS